MRTDERLLIIKGTPTIGKGTQAINRDGARRGNITQHKVPQPRQVLSNLRSIGVTQLVKHIGFDSTLISTDLEDMGFHPDLL